jgi:hypothetical protein
MADKVGVAVDVIVKTSLTKAAPADLKKWICSQIKAAINKSSKLEMEEGKLTKGFSLTATLELTMNDKAKPPQVHAVMSMAVMATGMSAGTINLKTPADADAGNPDKIAGPAKDAAEALLENMLPKVIKAMEDKAKAAGP